MSDLEFILGAKDLTGKAFASANKGVKRLEGAMNALNTAIVGFGGGYAIKQFVDMGVSATRLRIGLESATGGYIQAADAQKFLRAETDRLGLVFENQIKNFAGISAATKDSALEGAATKEIFLGIAEAGSALALSSDQVSGAMLAVTQIISKGKVQAEELRGQLGERLPGAFKLAAKAMEMNTAELSKALEMGQVYSEDFLPKFAKALREKYGKAAEEAADKIPASMAKVQNSIDSLKVGTFKILGDDINTVVKKINKTLELNQKSFLDWVSNMQYGIKEIGGLINDTFGKFKPVEREQLELDKLIEKRNKLKSNGTLGFFTSGKEQIKELDKKIKLQKDLIESLKITDKWMGKNVSTTGEASAISKPKLPADSEKVSTRSESSLLEEDIKNIKIKKDLSMSYWEASRRQRKLDNMAFDTARLIADENQDSGEEYLKILSDIASATKEIEAAQKAMGREWGSTVANILTGSESLKGGLSSIFGDIAQTEGSKFGETFAQNMGFGKIGQGIAGGLAGGLASAGAGMAINFAVDAFSGSKRTDGQRTINALTDLTDELRKTRQEISTLSKAQNNLEQSMQNIKNIWAGFDTDIDFDYMVSNLDAKGLGAMITSSAEAVTEAQRQTEYGSYNGFQFEYQGQKTHADIAGSEAIVNFYDELDKFSKSVMVLANDFMGQFTPKGTEFEEAQNKIISFYNEQITALSDIGDKSGVVKLFEQASETMTSMESGFADQRADILSGLGDQGTATDQLIAKYQRLTDKMVGLGATSADLGQILVSASKEINKLGKSLAEQYIDMIAPNRNTEQGKGISYWENEERSLKSQLGISGMSAQEISNIDTEKINLSKEQVDALERLIEVTANVQKIQGNIEKNTAHTADRVASINNATTTIAISYQDSRTALQGLLEDLTKESVNGVAQSKEWYIQELERLKQGVSSTSPSVSASASKQLANFLPGMLDFANSYGYDYGNMLNWGKTETSNIMSMIPADRSVNVPSNASFLNPKPWGGIDPNYSGGSSSGPSELTVGILQSIDGKLTDIRDQGGLTPDNDNYVSGKYYDGMTF